VSEHPDSLAARIRQSRTDRGWSGRSLAAKAGVSVMSVSRAENGCAVLTETAARLARALGVSLDWLAGLETEDQQREGGPHDPRA
jgi:transcriptional regulator with XRE-family HTH domain